MNSWRGIPTSPGGAPSTNAETAATLAEVISRLTECSKIGRLHLPNLEGI